MEDSSIVELYWRRSEQAIPETARKYGAYCRAVAYNILESDEDAEECVNDTWLGAWGSMPDNRPARLAPYLAKLTRWLSLTRLRREKRLKRGGGAEVCLAVEELEEYLDSGADTQRQIEQKELTAALDRFLSALSPEVRRVFVRRYWYMQPIEELCAATGYSQSKVKSMLSRTRRSLAKFLKEEELC